MSSLLVEKENRVVLLTLNRPEKRNALSTDLLESLKIALAELKDAPDIKALVITGAGDKAFCAGADIKEQTRFTPEQAFNHMRWGQSIFDDIERFPLPTIAMIDGFALGGGLELALACDMRFASDRATFGNPEITLGNHPGWGGTQRLPKLVGQAHARQIMFTGTPVDAGRALRIGLVNDVFPVASLKDGVWQTVDAIARHYAPALKSVKSVVRVSEPDNAYAGMLAEAFGVSQLWGAQAQKEAQKEFFGK